MIFWIFAAVLTLAASLAVMYPFLQRQQNTSDLGHDVMVYKDQLHELERDVERGLISASDAVEARAEIGRRILRTDAGGDEQKTRRIPLAITTRLIAMSAVLSVPLLSWGIYAELGTPDLPAMPLAQRTTM